MRSKISVFKLGLVHTIVENSWYKNRNIRTTFDMIEYGTTHGCDENEDYSKVYRKDKNKIDQELLELNDLNRKVYTLNNFDLTEDQRLELAEVLKDNKQAQTRLIQIIGGHLEDQYDFESLKNLLKKDSEKKKIKLNF